MARAIKLFFTALVIYLIYALTLSTLPFMRRKKVSAQNKERLDRLDFRAAGGAGGDRALLVETPQDAFNIRVEMIYAAKERIDVVYHTVHKGGSTDAFFAALLQAAERGVPVRVLLDGKVGAADPDAARLVQAMSRHQNVTCGYYNAARLLSPWNWHALLHDKFLVVDGRYLLTGGRNIGDKYFAPAGYTGRVTNDRDVFVSRESGDDSVLDQAQDYIDALWRSGYVEEVRTIKRLDVNRELNRAARSAEAFAQENAPLLARALEDYRAAAVPCGKITLIHNPIHVSKKEPWVGHKLCDLMQQAQHSVTIQTPYATKNSSLLAAMKTAGDRVPLTMVTNSLASSPNFPAFSNYYVNRRHFVKTGADIFEYQSEDSIHGKSLVIDKRLGIVGSFNMDERSFYIDTETMLIIDSVPFAVSLDAAIDAYKMRSLCVCGREDCGHERHVQAQPVPRGKRFVMRLVSVFSRAFQFLI